MKYFYSILFLSLTIFSFSLSASEKSSQWTSEQKQLIKLNQQLPLTLKQHGFDAFAERFHPQYSNWYMPGDRTNLVSRERYLRGIKMWFDDGNYTTFSKVTPISVKIVGVTAYMRHQQEEHYINNKGKRSKFIGHYASVLKKHNNKWTMFHTSFHEKEDQLSEYLPKLWQDAFNGDKHQTLVSRR